ncbi:TonB-dependent receptor [Acinetobacter sp. B5B]|uniref:TonB-dependent receptor n=1 Tax=Acinetobacter baretiae TaxID=2605383 RepID=UPI0018C271B0|nr:TonB-dependent receptor [Acinetobacter baretiae]MBF7683681.1 TonB-dependent receptor [Acinetobacter baretiae]MBF7686540.1 TonB-dependent receptor [Acinetobacter baretiae]
MIKTNPLSKTFNLKPIVICVHFALVSTLTLSAHSASAATGEMKSYNIGSNRLNHVLSQFADQAGVTIAMNGSELSKMTSSGLQGEYQTEQGFNQLLSNTNYHVEKTNNGYVVLKKSETNLSSNIITTGALNIAGATGRTVGENDTASSVFDTYKMPGSVQHVSREMLDRVAYSRTGDIFNDTPGVAAANSTNSTGLQVNIRGLQGQGRVRTLIDGAQQSVSTYRGYPGNRDDTYIDPDLIGAIDIKKGPNAGATSAGVIGGVVSLRTLNADDIITDPNKNWGVRIRGSIGNNIISGDTCMKISSEYTKCINRSQGTAVTSSQWSSNISSLGGKIPTHNLAGSIATAWRPTQNWDITIAHAERESGNYKSGKHGIDKWKGIYRDFEDTEVANTSIDSNSTLIKTRVRFLEDHSLALSYLSYENNAGYYSSTAGMFTGPRVQGVLRKTIAKNYTANYAWKPNSPWFDLKLNVWGTRVEGGEDLPDTMSTPNIKMKSNIIGGELFNISKISVPVGYLNIKYGLSLSKEKTTFGLNEDLDTSYGMFVHGQKSNTGLFTSLDWQATPWLNINAGLQHNKSDADNLDTRIIRSFQGNFPQNQKKSFTTNAPNVNIIIQPIDELQFFASWNKGKRTPSIRELYMSTVVESDPNLRPESQRNFEYGISFSKQGLITEDDKFGVKISRFDNLTKDYIARVNWASLGEDRFDHHASYVFHNIDKVQLKGYELSLDYENHKVFSKIGLSYFDSIKACYPDRNDDNEAIPSQCYSTPGSDDWSASYMPPRFETKATLGFKFLDDRLKVGGKIRRSTSSLSGGSMRGVKMSDMIWDKYTVYDLFGDYKFNKNWAVGFSIENLTDQYYIPSYSNALEALPAPGRTARGTITFNF